MESVLVPNKSLRKFRVVHENGLFITDNLNIMYKYPFQSEFNAERISQTHIKMVESGQTVAVLDDEQVHALEVDAIEDMTWSIVINAAHGVHVYHDKYLSLYLCTIPNGARVFVSHRMVVNGKQVFYVYNGLNSDVSGFIGCDAYHYAHQQSPITLVPMSGILFGRILNPDGVLVRKTREIYSPVVGVLHVDAKVYIEAKDFTSLPCEKNLHRYKLVNEKGWINAYICMKNGIGSQATFVMNVEIQGHVPCDSALEKETMYEMAIMPCYTEQELLVKENDRTKTSEEMCVSCMAKERNAVFVHEGGFGHRVCCIHCAEKVEQKQMGCPICRLPIERVIQIF